MNEPGERLLNLARALSDGERVDWERAAAESEGEDERELLTLLQEIEHVAEVHRTLRREGQAAGPPSSTIARWGPLEIQEKIGEGASAEVFRARDPRLDRDVALKLFRHGQWMSPEKRRALLLEGQNLARLRHENVVSVHGAGEHDDRVGIWMELVEGKTLSDMVKAQGPYSAMEAAQIGIELCRALAAVHRKNLVHADIKAQNVKREAGGRIVLMDFSSSRRADGSPGNPESDPMGTPLYMAPELWERNTPTVESDIYSLGVLMYHLVTGEFPVRASSIDLLRQAHASGERCLLRDERPDLPEAFVRTVEKALSRSPRERFRSAGAFEEGLRAPQTPAVKEPPLPLEVRVIARAVRIGLWVGAIFWILVSLGFITSTALNVVLGRPSEYAPEHLGNWLVWGARSLLGPMHHAIVTIVPLLGALVVLHLAYRVGPARGWLMSVARRAEVAMASVSLAHIAVVGAMTIAALTWWHYDLIDAIYAAAGGTVDDSTLAVLSPENMGDHLAYRRDFTLLVIALALAAFALRGRVEGRKRSARIALWVVIACALVLMEFPWQILWQASFPRVEYEGVSCYEVGSSQDDLLLYCPLSSESKTRLVARSDERLTPTGVIESVFTPPPK